MTFCLVFVFGFWLLAQWFNNTLWLLGFSKKNLLFVINAKTKGFHMRQLFFCTMDGFFRILKKTSFHLLFTRLRGVSGFLKVGGGQVVMRRGATAGGAFYSAKKWGGGGGGAIAPLPPPLHLRPCDCMYYFRISFTSLACLFFNCVFFVRSNLIG